MTKYEFESLKKGDYFHDKIEGDEWVVLSKSTYNNNGIIDIWLNCKCTISKSAGNWVGKEYAWRSKISHYFTKGKKV